MIDHMKNMKILQKQSGFTLPELLIAVVLTGIAVTFIGNVMITMMQRDRNAEVTTATRLNLTRALDFISDDVRSALRVSNTAPSVSGLAANDDAATFKQVIHIQKVSPNLFDPAINATTPSNVTDVTYYTRASTSTWLRPRTIIRETAVCTRNSSNVVTSCTNVVRDELIDGITNTSQPPTCPNRFTSGSTPTPLNPDSSSNGPGGLFVRIQNNRNVQICIAGALPASVSSTPLQAETVAAVRSGDNTP